jgi:hypothetical protein
LVTVTPLPISTHILKPNSYSISCIINCCEITHFYPIYIFPKWSTNPN